MATIKTTSSGLIITKTIEGQRLISCSCCTLFQITVEYSWAGTGQRDLDTATTAFGYTLGFACGGEGNPYVKWITGDNISVNGREQVDVLVDTARQDGLWTSSTNIVCKAGWYSPAGGSGPATLIVSYKNRTKTQSISPGSQNGCASTTVATVTVYSQQQGDGSFFEIL